jgi:hypothetical protein
MFTDTAQTGKSHGWLLRAAVTLLLCTAMMTACSDSPTDPDPTPEQSSLMLGRLVVSMVPGASESVTICAADAAGGPDPCTITNSNPAVASATLVDSTIRIKGLAIGTAEITITSGRGLQRTLPVRVYSPRVLETKDLFITYVDRYDLRWNDLGSGGTYDGSFYHPLTQDGYKALGTLGLGPDKYPNPNGTRAVMVVKARPGHEDAVAYPVDYELIYKDVGSGADMFGSFWRPVPPSGYVAMGTVVSKNTWNKPALTDVVCVRKDLTMMGEATAFIYSDVGTGANMFLSCWKIDQPVSGPHEMAYLVTGTFVAINNWTCPTASPMINVLKVDLPTLAEAPYQSFVPRLAGYDAPAEETMPMLGKAMLVPCSIINDRLHGDIGWKVAHSPMYRLERCVYYKLLYHNHNQTSELQTNSFEVKTGISQSEASRVWSETAISLSVEAGVSIKFFDARVTATVSRAMGYETETSITEFKEKTVSTSVNIPAGKAAALWQKYTRYVLYRHVGTELEPVSVWEFGTDSYVTDEYPR